MKYIIKDTPIRKDGKTYGVGSEYPYTEKDKKLKWNLKEVKETASKTKTKKTNT